MLACIDVPLDILDFWREINGRFPTVAQVARWLLIISMSSAEVERLFSRGGLVITSRRNRLGADKEELLLLLLTAYNLTRAWKEAGGVGSGEENAIMMARLYSACEGGLDFDE